MAHRKQIRQTHLLRGRDGGWQAAFWSCGTGREPILLGRLKSNNIEQIQLTI